MVDIVNLPIGNDINLDLSMDAGVVKLSVGLKLLPLLEGIRATSTNAIENAILDVAINALKASVVAPVVAAPAAPSA